MQHRYPSAVSVCVGLSLGFGLVAGCSSETPKPSILSANGGSTFTAVGTCVSPLTSCATGCVDLTQNSLNCGTCNNACAVPTQTCTTGACVCAAGYSQCAAGCANTQTDPANCGACGTACVSPQVCSLGGCSDSCAAGLSACGQSCVDLNADIANCSACGNACGAGQTCNAGACTCTTVGQTVCGNSCTDVNSDSQNCGRCGTVCASGVCSAGTCQGTSTGTGGAPGTGGATGSGGSTTSTASSVCSAGLSLCYGACVDAQTDPANCGTCGTSCATGTCNAGVCPTVKDCYKKTAITAAAFTNFESYDGTTTPTNWGFAFNGASGSSTAVYAGPWFSNDGTGTPTMSMLTGYNSTYSMNIANGTATGWGGALGFWMGCIDATAWQGLSMWVKGTAPTGKVNVRLDMEATSAPKATDPLGGGTCVGTADAPCKAASYDIPLTSTWTKLLIPWASFSAGSAAGVAVPVTGNNITGMTFSVPAVYVQSTTDATLWVPTPGPFDFSVDDIQFIGSGACLAGLSLCGVGCTDLATDKANCGTCGNACDVSRQCVSGSCVCPAGYTECGGECVDTKIDVQHCGACNAQCSGECSGGTCAPSSCTTGMTKTGNTCTAGDKITLGKYYVSNNQWGTGNGATGNQCIWQTCQSGNTIGWGTSWNWSGGTASSVKSYNSSVYGWHWTDNTSLAIPFNANSTTTINCGWTFAVTGSSVMNVAYDLFAHTTASPTSSSKPTDEIMIWLYAAGGAGPLGSQIATVSISGTSYKLYTGNNGEWNVYSYVRAANTTSATIDVMDFMKDLMTRNLMGSNKYVSTIEAGTEVFSGTGTLDTTAYYCTIK